MMHFSKAQLAALDCLKNSRRNMLLSGVAGAGKSALIKAWLESLKDGDTPPLLIAPTGKAAVNIGGMTIHRAFSIDPQKTDLEQEHPHASPSMVKHCRGLDTVCCDESSMMRADMLGYIDRLLRVTRNSDVPFGGVRFILVGDYWQLPPVTKDEEWEFMLWKHGSKTGWNMLSPTFEEANFETHFLTESFRQKDDDGLVEALNLVRNADPRAVKAVHAICKRGSEAPVELVHLCARNRDADKRNDVQLRKLDGETVTLQPEVWGKIPKDMWAERQPLDVKLGAPVLICRNRPTDAPGANFVNGTSGILRDLDRTTTLIAASGSEQTVAAAAVELADGSEALVPYTTLEMVELKATKCEEGKPKVQRDVVGTIRKFPLKLGWAISIHKSQGMTMEACVVDMGARGAFAHGMAYVALSRVVRAAGLYLLRPLRKSDLILDKEVPRFFGVQV